MTSIDPPIDLKTRTKKFALRIINLYTALPQNTVSQIIGKQLLRSGTSVGAHYCEGARSRSNAEFVSKLEGGLQELEETIYWLELIIEASIFDHKEVDGLIAEAHELSAILTTCAKKVKRRNSSNE
jgi:four helix bundle protein